MTHSHHAGRWLRWSLAAVFAVVFAVSCATGVQKRAERAEPPQAHAIVTASAYNSHPDQTDGDPFLSASGKRLEPGMKALAVSSDLFAAGLDFGTRVRIDGVDGEWVVLDRMPSGRSRAIDLYFGLDEQAALRFGKKRVRIAWRR